MENQYKNWGDLSFKMPSASGWGVVSLNGESPPDPYNLGLETTEYFCIGCPLTLVWYGEGDPKIDCPNCGGELLEKTE